MRVLYVPIGKGTSQTEISLEIRPFLRLLRQRYGSFHLAHIRANGSLVRRFLELCIGAHRPAQSLDLLMQQCRGICQLIPTDAALPVAEDELGGNDRRDPYGGPVARHLDARHGKLRDAQVPPRVAQGDDARAEGGDDRRVGDLGKAAEKSHYEDPAEEHSDNDGVI